jgi:transposase
MKDRAPSARKRAELIMKVRCGLMSATQAAAELGVSRKTYYKWERKGLAGLLESVGDRPAGRHPQGPEPRESLLEKQLEAMGRENEVLRQRMALKDIAIELNVRSGSDRTKKK